jgi:hypothetical protein
MTGGIEQVSLRGLLGDGARPVELCGACRTAYSGPQASTVRVT